ncbi:MAG: UDP-N-acetylmuramoyl-L-alanine--D-glutamate ligase [Bacteroidales bacterium]|nr:UDP-N-acetylmuramoyl-L-alanine--D-glutamate ligase [Bacteroidales bacterium]
MIDLIRVRFEYKSIVLLGFGREGQSTYSLLRKVFPEKPLTIADLSETVRENPMILEDKYVQFITGTDYLRKLNDFDVIFRSPGIPVWQLISHAGEFFNSPGDLLAKCLIPKAKITSQTELFLEFYSKQVIGITGTKGKSTTASLIHHIFKTAGKDVLLAGNIGNPVFHFIDIIDQDTVIVIELSSHQLEFLKLAPRFAVLLNVYQEHLDAYENYEAYQLAKSNITKYQHPGDFIIYNDDDPLVKMLIEPYLANRTGYPFSMQLQPRPGGFVQDGVVCFSTDDLVVPVWKIHQDRFLRGEHNLKNILAAVNVAMLYGIDTEVIRDGIGTFKGLAHRLEYVGEFGKIHFYNDSIATIPEACMEAIKAIPNVDTLIAGGFDRGIDYSLLADFLSRSAVRNFILVGEAGKRIMEHLALVDQAGKKLFCINRFDEFKEIAFGETKAGCTCLLSPAAASYDEFRNFEERGKRFRELVSGEVAK